VERFRQWSWRISAEHPGAPRPLGPHVLTRDGQELLVEANGVGIDLVTRWGPIRVESADLAEIVSLRPADGASAPPSLQPATGPAAGAEHVPTHRVRFGDGSVLLASLGGPKIALSPRLGGRLELAPDQIIRLDLTRRQEIAPWWSRLETAGGECLVGGLHQEVLRLRTGEGVVEVKGADVREISPVPAMPGGVEVKRWEGGPLGGFLESGEIRFRLSSGQELLVSARQMVHLTCPVRGPAEDFARLLSQRVARLGSERFRERDEAMRELIEMGPIVVPLLEPFREHADPEVRERIRMILEQLKGKAGP
jgi:hypothetical protein